MSVDELCDELGGAMSEDEVQAALAFLENDGLIRIVRRKRSGGESKLLIGVNVDELKRRSTAYEYKCGRVVGGAIEWLPAKQFEPDRVEESGGAGEVEKFHLPPGISL